MFKQYKEPILVFVLALLLAAWGIQQAQPNIDAFFASRDKASQKEDSLTGLKRKLDTLKTTKTEKDIKLVSQVKKIYKPTIQGLDAESSFTVLFDDVIEIAKNNGIKIYSMEYLYNPKSDEFVVGSSNKFNVCQLNLQLIGNYSDVEGFFKDLYKYPYLVNLDTIELTPYEKNKTILLGQVQLKLYTSK